MKIVGCFAMSNKYLVKLVIKYLVKLVIKYLVKLVIK